jgi:hypothetical protein
MTKAIAIGHGRDCGVGYVRRGAIAVCIEDDLGTLVGWCQTICTIGPKG